MTIEELILKELKASGRTPEDLTSEEFQALSLKVRSPIGKLEAAVSTGESRLRTLLVKVPLPIYWERREACETKVCGKHVNLKDDTMGCLGCGCSGTNLDHKLHDPYQECPLQIWGRHA